MSLKDLLESGANVTVAVKLDDLREILKEAAGSLKPVRQEPPPEEFFKPQRGSIRFANRLV